MSSPMCYFPNGTLDPKGKPCPRSGSNVANACCHDRHYCLTNGLCLEPRAWSIYRNSCTDRTFRASGCPQICHTDDIPGADRGKYKGVWYCERGAVWACENRRYCQQYNFTLAPQGKIMLNEAAQSDFGIVATATATTATTGPTDTGIAVCSALAESTASISVGAAAGIGAGFGVPLLIAVGSLTVLLLREKKRLSAATAATATMTAEADDGKKQDASAAALPGWAHQQQHQQRQDGTQGSGELGPQQVPTELPSNRTTRHELPH